MRTIKDIQYYPEDLVPYSVVRNHLRYDYGDAEDLIESYVASATDYLQQLTNYTFCSSSPAQHEDGLDAEGEMLYVDVQALESTITVYLDASEIGYANFVDGMSGSWSLDSAFYRDNTGEWLELAGTEGHYIDTDTNPLEINLVDFEEPDDFTERKRNVLKFVFTGGSNVKDLPKQFTQAALLLVGHYDTTREAEHIGGLTTEIKEGVRRLVQSARRY